MKLWAGLFVLLFLAIAPACALTAFPAQQDIVLDANNNGAGNFSVSTSLPSSCTFLNLNPANIFDYTTTIGAKGTLLVSFSVSAHSLPFRDFVRVTCSENRQAATQTVMVAGQQAVRQEANLSRFVPLYDKYSEPSAPQFDPKDLQYIEYPYFPAIGTGLGSDIILAMVVAILSAYTFWQGVDS